MKKLLYVAHVRMPSERAHSAQIASMCSAFAHEVEVELVVPDRKKRGGDTFAYYDLPENFTVTYLKVPDLVRFGWLGYVITLVAFSFSLRRYARRVAPDIVYGREALPLFSVGDGPWRIGYEVHEPRVSFLGRRVLAVADCVVAISEGVKEVLSRFRSDVEVFHDGISSSWLEKSCDHAGAREYLGLGEGKIAMYVGSLSRGKGVDVFCEAAAHLKDWQFVVIGPGEEEWQKKYPDVTFLGGKPYAKLPEFQCAADVLVIPNSLKDTNASLYTSPLKLFAHLASSVPVVASSVPALTSVVSEKEVVFVSPDNAEDLACGIGEADDSRVEAARVFVRGYTWEERAKNILNCL